MVRFRTALLCFCAIIVAQFIYKAQIFALQRRKHSNVHRATVLEGNRGKVCAIKSSNAKIFAYLDVFTCCSGGFWVGDCHGQDRYGAFVQTYLQNGVEVMDPNVLQQSGCVCLSPVGQTVPERP
ncbi:hypothetical protein QCD60_23755 [Pokkaliibacter sp. MBI-7]|uniref:hypothetical protein n=1 Tax=Pokkaliibacter sp. MBI-7 TaxID=3040600 RepID=UPI0024488C3B|nr:hypothetical protein [Pokkaliibacter sp. MBI-7]MDH2435543.1 hypothetical protein [Pokkaliibacter sp. MBI-7]